MFAPRKLGISGVGGNCKVQKKATVEVHVRSGASVEHGFGSISWKLSSLFARNVLLFQVPVRYLFGPYMGRKVATIYSAMINTLASPRIGVNGCIGLPHMGGMREMGVE